MVYNMADGNVIDHHVKACQQIVLQFQLSLLISPLLSLCSALSLAGEEFPSLLGIQFSPRYYGIPKSADVPAEYFPIQFVDSANVTAAPAVVGGPTTVVARDGGGRGAAAKAAAVAEGGTPSYMYPVDRVLRVPVGERAGGGRGRGAGKFFFRCGVINIEVIGATRCLSVCPVPHADHAP